MWKWTFVKPSETVYDGDMDMIAQNGPSGNGPIGKKNFSRAECPRPAPPVLSEEELAHGMALALEEARLAASEGEVPAGCVILMPPPPPATIRNPTLFRVLSRAHNRTEGLGDPTAHAEVQAISQAAATLGDWRLDGTVLFVTKEPCPMCAGAIVLARIPLVVYGMADPRRGGVSVFNILNHPGLNHRAEVRAGVMEEPCRELFLSFFRDARNGK